AAILADAALSLRLGGGLRFGFAVDGDLAAGRGGRGGGRAAGDAAGGEPQVDLGAVFRFFMPGGGADVRAVGHQHSGTDVVLQVRRNDLIDDPPTQLRRLDGEHYLHAALEVPRHPIGAAQVGP